jgi:hypothetical protein
MAVPDPQFPPDHPLAGIDAKLRRAEQNFKLIDDQIGAYLRSLPKEPIPTVGRYDAQEKRIRWAVGDIAEPDLLLATLIGDFVHDLRSALDHLAFELSFLDTGGTIPDRRIAYPCCWTDAQWKHKKVRVEKLRGINKTHRAMIYKTQPCYRRSDTVKAAAARRRNRHPLADLQEFWDHDKHRTLQPVASVPSQIHGETIGSQDCKGRGMLHLDPEFLGQPLYAGMECFWLPVWPTGPHPLAELYITLGVHISFRNGLPALFSLRVIGEWVGSVIGLFAPVFETRKAKRLWNAPRGGWIDEAPLPMRRYTYRTQRDLP